MFWKKHKPKKATEVLDSTPVAMPVNFHRPPTLQEQIQRLTRQSLNKLAAQEGKESFEEADDFDIGEDFEPASPHEIEFGPEKEAEFERVATNALRKAAALKDKKAAEAAAKQPAGPAAAPPVAGGQ